MVGCEMTRHTQWLQKWVDRLPLQRHQGCCHICRRFSSFPRGLLLSLLPLLVPIQAHCTLKYFTFYNFAGNTYCHSPVHSFITPLFFHSTAISPACFVFFFFFSIFFVEVELFMEFLFLAGEEGPQDQSEQRVWFHSLWQLWDSGSGVVSAAHDWRSALWRQNPQLQGNYSTPMCMGWHLAWIGSFRFMWDVWGC